MSCTRLLVIGVGLVFTNPAVLIDLLHFAHTFLLLQALVDVIHAFTVTPPHEGEGSVSVSSTAQTIFVDVTATRLAVKLYASLLLCPEQSVSFAAKSAMIRILKPAGPVAGSGKICRTHLHVSLFV